MDTSISNISFKEFADTFNLHEEFYVWRFDEIIALNPDLQEPHFHPKFEFFIIEGTAEFFHEGVKHSLQGKNLIFIPPGCVHSWKGYHQLHGYCFYFDHAFHDEGLSEDAVLQSMPWWSRTDFPPCLPVSDDCWDELMLLSSISLHESKSKKYSKYHILKNSLRAIFIHAKRIYEQQTELYEKCPTSPSNEKVRKSTPASSSRDKKLYLSFLRHLDAQKPRIYEPDHYAQAIQCQTLELSRILKKMSGKSLVEVLRDQRLLEAQWHLANTQAHLQEIAKNLGFVDSSYFSKFFYKYTGMTPSEYREKLHRHSQD